MIRSPATFCRANAKSPSSNTVNVTGCILIAIRLYESPRQPMREAEYRITMGERVHTGTTTNGWLTERLPNESPYYVLEWREPQSSGGSPSDSPEEYSHRRKVEMKWTDMDASSFHVSLVASEDGRLCPTDTPSPADYASSSYYRQTLLLDP